jgi:hypothetical protein
MKSSAERTRRASPALSPPTTDTAMFELKPTSGTMHRFLPRHPPRAEERPGGERLIDPPHQLEILVIGWRRRRYQGGGSPPMHPY